jgi:excisionase family DNA binding protein
MKHSNPPENLPVIPERSKSEPQKDTHFRSLRTGDIVSAVPVPKPLPTMGTPASRSLQPIRLSMNEHKERPVRAPDDLLSIDDVAQRLLVSRAAVYRLVSRRRLPFYRLPGGIRFKVKDVDAHLENRRSERVEPKKYGSPQAQR